MVGDEAHRILGFLADASRILVSSADLDDTLRQLADLAVPRIADCCAIGTVDEQPQRLTIAYPDPDVVKLALETTRASGLPPGVLKVIADRAPIIHPELDATTVDRLFADVVQREVVKSMGVSAYAILPLLGRERAFGFLGLAIVGRARRLGEIDILLAQEIAARAALAIENYRLYETQRTTANSFTKIWRASPAAMSISTFGEGRFLDVNPEFVRLSGFSREEIVGHTGREPAMWVDVATRDHIYKALGEHRSARDVEVRLRRKNGEVFTALVSYELIELDGQTCLLSLGQDLTEYKRLQEQLRHAQKMDALGRLAGGIAHDFNNILTAISGYCELAVRSLPADAPALSHAMHILRSSQRASRLTKQLLAFGRQQILEPTPLDLNEVVRRMASMLRRLIGEDIVLALQLSPTPARVVADQGQLEQLLLNLVVNARDAMPRGGQLTVETSGVDADDGRWVRLSVIDNGVGMDEATRARIFEPFFTTKESGKGIGLGLATVHGIVEQSGGRIMVESAPGQGTTFHVHFPETTSPSRRAETPSPMPALPPLCRETLLLAEDDEEVREFVRVVLTQQGYRVLVAEDGEEALALAARVEDSIDLLVSDVVMPRMNGRELADRLCQVRPALRVLHMSGYPGDTIDRYGDLRPGAAFLQKPFTADALLKRVRALLDQPSEP
jgi:PAS domain S-box-containing protein